VQDGAPDHDRELVLVAHHPDLLGAEQPLDLLRDGGEDVSRRHFACDQRRHPPQRRLLAREPLEVLARLGVRDRGREQVREVGQQPLRPRRERMMERGDRHGAPHLAADDDGHGET
jgi:hypothetical protein